MPFSPGKNGKGAEKIKQNGKLKNNDFCKQKRRSRDKTRPAFAKERLIAQSNALRKAFRKTLQKERLTHHQVPRSPQRRSRIEAAEEVVPAEEVGLPHAVSLVTEPSSSTCLVTEELTPPQIAECKEQ